MAHRSTWLRAGYWITLTAGLLLLITLGAAVRSRHRLDALILEAARSEGLPPGLVAAVAWRESRFNPAAVGPKGEIGLMQITGAAATDWARTHQLESLPMDALWHPATNVTVGTWYLGRAARHWDGQGCSDPFPFALAEYNAGRSKVNEWKQIGGPDPVRFVQAIEFESTRRYVEDVLKRYRRRIK